MKQRKEIALLQIFADRVVIGKIPVVNQGFVHAAERVGPARMPDAALGRIALMGDPDVGLEFFQLVIAGDQLGIAHDLQNHHVLAVGHDKGFFVAQRGIKPGVELERILAHEFVFGPVPVSEFSKWFFAVKSRSTSFFTRTK